MQRLIHIYIVTLILINNIITVIHLSIIRIRENFHRYYNTYFNIKLLLPRYSFWNIYEIHYIEIITVIYKYLQIIVKIKSHHLYPKFHRLASIHTEIQKDNTSYNPANTENRVFLVFRYSIPLVRFP